MRSTIRSAGLALAMLGFVAAARAETTICTEITGWPFLISAPGVYCLKHSLAANVSIEASDVVLDLNGHVLEGTVHAFERQNITVRNGTIRGGSTGVQITGANSRSHLIERLRISDNASAGIYVQGDGSVVRHNMLLNNGFSASGGAKRGLLVSGDGIHVADNQIVETGVGATGEVVGIQIHGSGVTVERNVISNAQVGTHNSRGITIWSSGRNSVVNNRVINMKIGIMNGACPTCGGTAVFMDNTVGGATTPFVGGVMAGTTNTSF